MQMCQYAAPEYNNIVLYVKHKILIYSIVYMPHCIYVCILGLNAFWYVLMCVHACNHDRS